jgi:hypothetical protein
MVLATAGEDLGWSGVCAADAGFGCRFVSAGATVCACAEDQMRKESRRIAGTNLRRDPINNLALKVLNTAQQAVARHDDKDR